MFRIRGLRDHTTRHGNPDGFQGLNLFAVRVKKRNIHRLETFGPGIHS